MNSSRSLASRAFRAAVLADDVGRARRVWQEKAHRYPSVLPMAWSCVVGGDGFPESDMERFLAECSTAKSTPLRWRSKACCEALFRVHGASQNVWDRRWDWAKDHVRWKTLDTKALAIQLAYGSQSEAAEDYRSRLKDVLSQTPYLPGMVWGLLGESKNTRDLALELPAATHTTAEFRGGIVALSCLASSLEDVSSAWLEAFLERGLPIENDIHVLADVSHVDEEKQGAHRLAFLLDMEAVDLYRLSRFAHVDAYEDAFVNETNLLKVDLVWGRSKASAPETPLEVASRFRSVLMESRLEPAGPSPTKKPRV